MREIKVEKIVFETEDGKRFNDRGVAIQHEDGVIDKYLDTVTGHELARIVYHFAPSPVLPDVSIYEQVRMAIFKAIESEKIRPEPANWPSLLPTNFQHRVEP